MSSDARCRRSRRKMLKAQIVPYPIAEWAMNESESDEFILTTCLLIEFYTLARAVDAIFSISCYEVFCRLGLATKSLTTPKSYSQQFTRYRHRKIGHFLIKFRFLLHTGRLPSQNEVDPIDL